MRVYREWADFMFPKLQFGDVVKRIDRLSQCTRSMRVYPKSLRAALAEGRDFDETAFMTGLALEEIVDPAVKE